MEENTDRDKGKLRIITTASGPAEILDIINASPSTKRAGKGLSRKSVVTVNLEAIDTSMDYKLSGKFGYDLLVNIDSSREVPDVSCNKIEENFSSLKELCEGSHSNIFKVDFPARKDSQTSKDIVKGIVKQMKKTSVGNKIAACEFEREKQFLTKLVHPNIVILYSFGVAKALNCPFLVLERLDGGTLSSFMSSHRPFNCRPFGYMELLKAAIDFCSALKYLHHELPNQVCIIHRDLKPDNLAFTSTGTLKIIDFGLCVSIKKTDNLNDIYELTGSTGSLRYMAHEVALNAHYNEKVDIYSFGVILYEMVTGVTPFKGFGKAKFISEVIEKHYRPPTDFDDYLRKIKVSKEIINIIESSWNYDYKLRPTANTIFEILSEELEKHKKLGSTFWGRINTCFFSRNY
jgi:serine/threonine protein kinase